MKEVEFINSRVEQARSQQNPYRPEDSSPNNESKNTASPDVIQKTPLFTRDERTTVIQLLQRYRDIMAIYRLTLENRIRTTCLNGNGGDVDVDRNETIIKLKEDSLYVSNLLDNLIREIQMTGGYGVLVRNIANNRKKHADEIAIAKDYEEAVKDLDKHQNLLEEETRMNSLEREKLRKRLILSENETRQLQYKVNIELKYVKFREEARREAHSLRCIEKLQRHKDRLGSLCAQEKNEYRVAADIVKFLEENITENAIAKFQWQKRYERETLMYASGNERLSREIENKRDALEKLQLQYRERQAFMDAYVAETEAAMELRKREEHRRHCATRIQAWWRGVIVRRQLGPYRADERKKKKPVKSKK